MHYCDACREGAWHLEIWPRADPSKIRKIPFSCRSWRHEGECRAWRGAQDFVRCREAILKHEYWSHVTLTFDQRAKTLSSVVFRRGLSCWAKLRKRLTREYGNILYIQTWEVHRSGWPHVHIALSNQDIHGGFNQTPEYTFKYLLKKHAVESGFGSQGTCSPIRDKEAMSGYLVKLCRELTGGGKGYQIPRNAPKGFRRLRASVRLLPPCLKDPELTGQLRRFPLPDEALTALDNTGTSGRSEQTFSIEESETYREKLVNGRWVTEGLE